MPQNQKPRPNKNTPDNYKFELLGTEEQDGHLVFPHLPHSQSFRKISHEGADLGGPKRVCHCANGREPG
jgi:hypothetical protein